VRAIGASTWIWVSPLTDDALAELAPKVRGLGFDVIELQVEEQGQWDPGRAGELAAEHGLGTSLCCVMPPGRDLALADHEAATATRAYLEHCVEVAARIGSPVVAGPMYAAVGRVSRMGDGQRRATLERVAERLRPVAELAGERGVRLAVEPLNRYETSLINTVGQGLELVELVGSDACGLLLDTYHMNIEEKHPAGAAREAGERIFHVHGCGTDRGSPGEDDFAWPEFFAALDEAGYEGTIAIESFTPDNEAIAVAASIWRPLAPSPDDLAAAGLRFLRARTSRSRSEQRR
jgi:D-psicose/D-tagatose/L-ribulose 3-epimerase